MTSRSRDFCFTYHGANAPVQGVGVTYLVAQQEECPTTGKVHWQGYAEFKSQKTIPAAQKAMEIEGAHMEKRKGTPTEAAEYCKKEESRKADGVAIELGERRADPEPGKRNDLIALRDAAKSAKSVEELHCDAHVECYANHMKFAKEVMYLSKKRRTATWRDVVVEIYWGDTRTGKTRKVMEMGDVYKWTPSDPIWFDGYDGEKILLIDEFYGQTRCNVMLELLEGHQCRLPVKGNFTFAEWDKVFITSNTNPKEWYPNVPEEVRAAFHARVSKVTHFANPLGV